MGTQMGMRAIRLVGRMDECYREKCAKRTTRLSEKPETGTWEEVRTKLRALKAS